MQAHTASDPALVNGGSLVGGQRVELTQQRLHRRHPTANGSELGLLLAQVPRQLQRGEQGLLQLRQLATRKLTHLIQPRLDVSRRRLQRRLRFVGLQAKLLTQQGDSNGRGHGSLLQAKNPSFALPLAAVNRPAANQPGKIGGPWVLWLGSLAPTLARRAT